MIHVKRILYPTDFSSHSNQAYFHAVALAETHGASLTILYVYVPGTSPLEGSQRGEAGQEYWRAQLEQIRPVNPDIAVRHVFREGDPASQIVRYAAETGIDLIV